MNHLRGKATFNHEHIQSLQAIQYEKKTKFEEGQTEIMHRLAPGSKRIDPGCDDAQIHMLSEETGYGVTAIGRKFKKGMNWV